MIYAARGLGKTWAALMIAYAVSSGGHFLTWKAEAAAGVLYIDGEMPLAVMKERLAQIVTSEDKDIQAPLTAICFCFKPSKNFADPFSTRFC